MNKMEHNTFNKELLTELQTEFDKWKNKEGFDSSLEELDEIFFIKDYILASRFVSPKLSRMVCGRIRDTFNSWIRQIHSWLIPTPNSIISNSETQLFGDKEKEELNFILREFMTLVSQNSVIGLNKNKTEESEFVDFSVQLWKKHLQSLIKHSDRVHAYWKSDINKDKKQVSKF